MKYNFCPMGAGWEAYNMGQKLHCIAKRYFKSIKVLLKVFQKIKLLLISKDQDPLPSFQLPKHGIWNISLRYLQYNSNELQPACLEYPFWNASQNISGMVGTNQLKHSTEVQEWRKQVEIHMACFLSLRHIGNAVPGSNI